MLLNDSTRFKSVFMRFQISLHLVKAVPGSLILMDMEIHTRLTILLLSTRCSVTQGCLRLEVASDSNHFCSLWERHPSVITMDLEDHSPLIPFSIAMCAVTPKTSWCQVVVFRWSTQINNLYSTSSNSRDVGIHKLALLSRFIQVPQNTKLDSMGFATPKTIWCQELVCR